MSCNLVIQSAVLFQSEGSDRDVTQEVQNLLSKQCSSSGDFFEIDITSSNFPPTVPSTSALGVTFYWQDRGPSWTYSLSCVTGQTLKIRISTPPKIIRAVYGSQNVTHDVTDNLQQLVSFHSGSNFDFQIGSSNFLNALFGSVQTNSGNTPIDPDFGVRKSLYVCYSQLYNNNEETHCSVGFDGTTMNLV